MFSAFTFNKSRRITDNISELLICGDTHLEMDMFGHNCLNFERIVTGIHCSKRFMLEEGFDKTFKVL